MSRSDILDLFEQHGIQPTPQRVEVAEIFLTKPQHMSADQIIDRLHNNGSSVSKATVYNTLNRFADRGLAREIMVDPVRKIYDSSTHMHQHFYNVDTGELSDIEDDAIRLAKLPELPAGTERESVDVVIRIRNTN